MSPCVPLRLKSCLALVSTTLFIATSVATFAAERPNVLMIAIDDLNDWVGPLGGHPQAQTPQMDRLAARGTTFTNAHCQTPLCNSSRTSLMTGLRPTTTGVYSLAPWFRTVPQLADLVSLPQAFKRAGYRTGMAGKIYHGGYPAPADRAAEFDVYGPRANFGPYPDQKFVNTPAEHKLVDWGVFPASDELQGDYITATWGVEMLEAEKDQPDADPFFYAVGFGRPHVPCYATQKWFDLYPEDTLQLPLTLAGDRDDTPRFSWYLHWALPEPRAVWLEQEHQWKPLVRAYLASVSFVDSQVGRLLDALEASGKADNTIVVLWSDHGWHLGEKGITGKNTLWDPSTRVPLIFAGPGIAVDRSGSPAELLDIYPTLAALAGIDAPAHLEGHSLTPQLANANAPRPWPAITNHNAGNNAVRTEDWRYIRYADGSEELYDLRADPEEWHNVIHRPDLAVTRAELARWIPAYNAPPVPGGGGRLLEYEDATPVWEGTVIHSDDPIPEL